MRRRYLLYLLAEFGAAILAVILFRLIPDRFMAGLIAGSAFVFLGFAIVLAGLADSQLRHSWSFRIAFLHLFVVSIPILFVRLLNSDMVFSELSIWGIPGPVFHKISEGVFLALVVGTIIDAYRAQPPIPKASADESGRPT